MRRTPPLLLIAVLALVTACGGGSDDGPGGEFPTASGSYGDKPTLTFPSGSPSTTLQSKVLTEGKGPAVKKGELLVADYLGQIWKGNIFDNSYDRHAPAGFMIGSGQVIPGWDEALVGVHGGSRVLLVVPPDKGYGSQGNQQAGIKGTDTLVFVVDVVRGYAATAAGDPKAARQKPPAGEPTVTGALAKRPTVHVRKGAKPPKKQETFLLAKGSGAKVHKDGFLILQYEAVSWAGKPVASTWKNGGPTGLPVGVASQPNPFDALVGLPIGSRVLIEIPAQKGRDAATESTAVAVDIIDETGTAKAVAAAA